MYHAKHPEGQRKSAGSFLGFEGNFLFHEKKKRFLPKKKMYFFS